MLVCCLLKLSPKAWLKLEVLPRSLWPPLHFLLGHLLFMHTISWGRWGEKWPKFQARKGLGLFNRLLDGDVPGEAVTKHGVSFLKIDFGARQKWSNAQRRERAGDITSNMSYLTSTMPVRHSRLTTVTLIKLPLNCWNFLSGTEAPNFSQINLWQSLSGTHGRITL